ncbi:MAG: hypothetical protein ACPGUV_01285, partial [Polyangiales bacterium]
MSAHESLTTALSDLKTFLQKADDFSELSRYFDDKLVRRTDFMKVSQPKENRKVEASVEGIVQRLFGAEQKITHFLPLTIKDTPFWHGPFFVSPNHMSGQFFYYSDIDSGLVTEDTNGDSVADAFV